MVFISYRRQDSAMAVGRICDRLALELGNHLIFRDIDDIPLGVKFTDHIDRNLRKCTVILAVIGNDWVGRRPNGTRRIDEFADFVRLEIEIGLQRGIPLIPVIIEPAEMLSPSELPPSISELAYINGLRLDPGRDFHVHMSRLIAELRRYIGQQPDSTRKLPKSSVSMDLLVSNNQRTSPSIGKSPQSLPTSKSLHQPVKPDISDDQKKMLSYLISQIQSPGQRLFAQIYASALGPSFRNVPKIR